MHRILIIDDDNITRSLARYFWKRPVSGHRHPRAVSSLCVCSRKEPVRSDHYGSPDAGKGRTPDDIGNPAPAPEFKIIAMSSGGPTISTRLLKVAKATALYRRCSTIVPGRIARRRCKALKTGVTSSASVVPSNAENTHGHCCLFPEPLDDPQCRPQPATGDS